ncbi:MAG: ABC transporter ATP-binding protein, partial [Terrimesophilobacter sp.]
MSDEKQTQPPTRPPVRRGPGGPMFGGASMPAEKSMNFGPSAKRLIARLRPEWMRVLWVLLLAVGSVSLSVVGPKLLGNGTTLIFEGAISASLPANVTKAQIIAGLRAKGQDGQADLLSGMSLTPGTGIDFHALSMILIFVLSLYILSSVFGWLQAYVLNDVVQGTVYRMREDIEKKINRLPLSYFDKTPRGELLSRVTNDIDNISQSLQQTLSQIVTSLLMVIGVLTMMLLTSPLLTLIALVTIPMSIFITVVIAKRSQKMFVAQWKHTGELNAQIEENFTGHALVKVFGRQKEVTKVFTDKNDELYQASFGAQFVSGIIMPSMMFVGNLVYVAIAVVGGLLVANG